MKRQLIKNKHINQNINFGKVVLILVLIFTMLIQVFTLPVNAVPLTKTMTIEIPEGEIDQSNLSKTITIPHLKEIVNISVNTGNVTHTIDTDKVTLNASGGTPSRTVQTGGSPANSKYVEGQTSSYYNSGGYSGTLEKYVYSGSYTPADSKTARDTRTGEYWTDWEDQPAEYIIPPSSIYYSSGGYSGSLPRVNLDKVLIGTQIDWGNKYKYTATYLGTVTKPASDTRVYRYKGTVYKPDTRTYDNYYSYTVTIEYIDNSDPSLEILLPEQNIYFSKEDGHNAISIEGNVKDDDIDDLIDVKYTLLNTTTITDLEEHTNVTIKSDLLSDNGKVYDFNYTIKVDETIPDGEYSLKLIAEDDKGGITEKNIVINIDNTGPTSELREEDVKAIDISSIELKYSAIDEGIGLHDTETYLININGKDIKDWTNKDTFIDENLDANGKYSYKVKAKDRLDNIGEYTGVVDRYTLALNPTKVILNEITDSSIEFEIVNDNGNANPPETIIQINDTNINTSWSENTTKKLNGLEAGKEYSFTLMARNGDNIENEPLKLIEDIELVDKEGKPIDKIVTKPSQPVLSASIVMNNENTKTINLKWDSVKGATKYALYVKGKGDSDYTLIDNGIKSTEYTHSGLIANKEYIYYLQAGNEFGWSVPSKTVELYTQALNPTKVQFIESTDTTITFKIVKNDKNEVTPDTKIVLKAKGTGNEVSSAGWNKDEEKKLTGLAIGEEYDVYLNTKNENEAENGWIKLGSDSIPPLVDNEDNPIDHVTTVIPVENFNVTDSSVSSLTVSWDKVKKQEYQVFLKDAQGNIITNSTSKWLKESTYTFSDLGLLPNTKYIPYISTRRVNTTVSLNPEKILNEDRSWTNAEGISRGTFESGEDYIIVKLNVSDTKNPSDTEYIIKNDITGQPEVKVTHDNPVWKNTNLARESFYTYSVKVINKNGEPSYFTRLVFENGDEAHTEIGNVDVPPEKIVPEPNENDIINLDKLETHNPNEKIWFNPEDLDGKTVILKGEKYRVTRNRIEEIENEEEIEVINYSYSREGFGYTDWKVIEEGFFEEKIVFNYPGIYRTHWKFKNYRIESNPALINYYVDWIKPTVEGEPYIKGQSAVTGSEFKVNIKAEDNISPYLFYSTDNGDTWYLLKEGQNTATFDIVDTMKTSEGKQNRLVLKISDIAGNVVEKTFTVWGIEKTD